MFGHAGREFRHNPCLMAPLTFVGVVIVLVVWTIVFVWKFPIFVLGYLLSPLLNRTQFIIEFFYPFGLGRTVHLAIFHMIQRTSSKGSKPSDMNRGFHSRSVETRIEVIPRGLYIHALPQLLDNLGYLVVCCGEPLEETVVEATPMADVSSITRPQLTPSRIVAFVVDCGDSKTVMEQIEMISETHYQGQKIYVQSILSTHKHHDHTAGNVAFRKNRANRDHFKIIVGGAVENVPGCNYTVGDGDMIPLPAFGSNDMGSLIEVEAVATPAHTRGSITYVLRVKPEYRCKNSALAFLFTGDTVFSAGGGVPFEADIDPGQEQKEQKKSFTSIIKASASLYAVERCFGEILARALKLHSFSGDIADKTFVMPGHEYTHELLSRQLTAGNTAENCRWKNFTPNVFFETVSQLYVTLHRRSLPYSSGKLISAMGSPISLELSINPYFRSMKRRGDIIIQAINFWHKQFARDKVPSRIPKSYESHATTHGHNGMNESFHNEDHAKILSTEHQWTLNATDLARPVFTTVYAADLDLVIRDLNQGALSPQEGAKRLTEMKDRLKEGLVSRRPVPASLPSDRAVYRGLLALALLGSSPTALSLSDSRKMGLPKPIVKSSDRIKISRSHLISVLEWLGLLTEERDGQQTVAMIHQLWKEALEDSPTSEKMSESANYDTIESGQQDIVELGDLKWQIYGVPRRQAAFSFCVPCAKPTRIDPTHPAHGARMKTHSGEIVRHDIYQCPICRVRAGCPHLPPNDEDDNSVAKPSRPVVTISESMPDEDEGLCVEVTSMLKGA